MPGQGFPSREGDTKDKDESKRRIPRIRMRVRGTMDTKDKDESKRIHVCCDRLSM